MATEEYHVRKAQRKYARHKERMLTDPEYRRKRNEKDKRRYARRVAASPEYRKRMNDYRKQNLTQRKAADPVYRKQFNRRKSLQALYGISLEDYAMLQTAQDNKCGICGLEPMPGDKALAVDCDHAEHPPLVRGLLCMKCNTSIGKFNHDPRLLQRAIDWLNGVR